MTFWGVEVKPGEAFILESDELGGSLILTQATLGLGSSNKRSILQVSVGDNKPIFLCSLLPGKSESFTLNLEFAEEEEVKFSIVGKTSIHISGYVQRPQEDDDDDVHECGDMDCCADDIDESESEDRESEFEDDFIVDDDMPIHPSSTVKNKGVVIEEIDDKEKPVSEKAEKKKNKKKEQQIVVKGETSALELESEDEDGFPVSVTGNGESRFAKLQANTESKISDKEKKNKKNIVKEDSESASNLKRKSDDADFDQEPKSDAIDGDTSVDNTKKKNKKNKRKAQVEKDETVSNTEQNAADEVANVKKDGEKKEKKPPTSVKETKESKEKPAKARTYANGLVIEEMEMGKPNGKRASLGKTVGVRYIGKLKKNDKIFDSNTSGKPFEFCLGIGQVIKGWDVGVEGMRIGDKRRLTIPPSMGYGASGAPPSIPPNAWLIFDVELVNVNS